MGQVLVRNLDDRVIDQLKVRAELKGHSLEQELREIISAAAPLTREERIARLQRIRERSPPMPPDFDVRAAIRAGRDDEFDE
jgi:antitoxin FitA